MVATVKAEHIVSVLVLCEGYEGTGRILLPNDVSPVLCLVLVLRRPHEGIDFGKWVLCKGTLESFGILESLGRDQTRFDLPFLDGCEPTFPHCGPPVSFGRS